MVGDDDLGGVALFAQVGDGEVSMSVGMDVLGPHAFVAARGVHLTNRHSMLAM